MHAKIFNYKKQVNSWQQPSDDIDVDKMNDCRNSGCNEDFRGKILLLHCAITKE